MQRCETHLADLNRLEDATARLAFKKPSRECIRLADESCSQARLIQASLAALFDGVHTTLTRALQMVRRRPSPCAVMCAQLSRGAHLHFLRKTLWRAGEASHDFCVSLSRLSTCCCCLNLSSQEELMPQSMRSLLAAVKGHHLAFPHVYSVRLRSMVHTCIGFFGLAACIQLVQQASQVHKSCTFHLPCWTLACHHAACASLLRYRGRFKPQSCTGTIIKGDSSQLIAVVMTSMHVVECASFQYRQRPYRGLL